MKTKLTFLQNRWFYIWLLPLLWCFFTVMSFFHSGDEHGCFVYGAIAGAWIGFLLQFDSLTTLLFPILLTGAVIIALFGLLMDQLKVGKITFFILLLLFGVLIFRANIKPFDSLEQIRGKHRSIFAIIFLTCNQSIYAAIFLSIIGNLTKRIWQKLTNSNQH